MNITIKPTSAKTLKRGDLFRNGGQTLRIAADNGVDPLQVQ